MIKMAQLDALRNVCWDLYCLSLAGLCIEYVLGYDFIPYRIRLAVLGAFVVCTCWQVAHGVCSFFHVPHHAVGPRVLVPRREKKTSSGSNDLFEYAVTEVQGWRPAMEDASLIELSLRDARLQGWSLFAVFDGHGGSQVSKWLANNVVCTLEDTVADMYPLETAVLPVDCLKACLLRTCATLDVKLKVCGFFDLVGSTCNWVMLSKDTMLCANIGDSRCIYSSDGKAIDVSVDHKPELPLERERIENAGGCVYQTGPCYRVDGCGLNLSRAFGDFRYKQNTALGPEAQKICAVPEMFVVDLRRSPIDFIIIGCDGVFELPSQEIADVVRNSLKSEGLHSAVTELADRCISPSLIQTQGKGGDNVSVIVILLKDEHSDS